MKTLGHGSSALLILCQHLTHGTVSTKGPSSSEDELNSNPLKTKRSSLVNSKQALDIMNCKQIDKAEV